MPITLEKAVKQLSVTAKQAMYVAGTEALKQGRGLRSMTWQGCAFNAAGQVHNKRNVSSSREAAYLFKMPVQYVAQFITTWDSMGGSGADVARTKYLLDLLDRVGLCTPPEGSLYSAGEENPLRHTSRVVREVKTVEYKSLASKFKEQLDSGELTLDNVPGCEAVMHIFQDA